MPNVETAIDHQSRRDLLDAIIDDIRSVNAALDTNAVDESAFKAFKTQDDEDSKDG